MPGLASISSAGELQQWLEEVVLAGSLAEAEVTLSRLSYSTTT